MTQPTAAERDAAFEALFQATYARVLSYARGMADAHDADDAVGETYAIAWRRLEDVPPGVELGWLIGVTRRVLSNTRRGRRRADALREALGLQPPLEAPDPADVVVDVTLGEALRALRRVDREALVMVAWFDLTPAEAALALGIGPAAFRMRLARARRRLRAVIDSPPSTKEQPQWHHS